MTGMTTGKETETMSQEYDKMMRQFADKYRHVCVANNSIDAKLFEQYGVKRGLRDKNGKGDRRRGFATAAGNQVFRFLPGERRQRPRDDDAHAGKHTALHLLLFRRGHTCRQQTANHLAVLVEGEEFCDAFLFPFFQFKHSFFITFC